MHGLYANPYHPPSPISRGSLLGWLTLLVGANNRGHFRFSDQSFKRCFEKKGSRSSPCYGGVPSETWLCYLDYFEEVGCTWRQVGVVPEATVSAPPPVPTTLVEVNQPRIPVTTESGALTSTIAA